jgi:hypothetical protein
MANLPVSVKKSDLSKTRGEGSVPGKAKDKSFKIVKKFMKYVGM